MCLSMMPCTEGWAGCKGQVVSQSGKKASQSDRAILA